MKIKTLCKVSIKSAGGRRTIKVFEVPEDVVDEFKQVVEAIDAVDAEPNDGGIDVRGAIRWGILKISGTIELELVDIPDPAEAN
jgi:hypothetical protein